MKQYNIMQNVGKCKYVVNYHDGIKKNKDGSNFYDIAIFRNKKKMNSFVSELLKDGYIYRNNY